MLVTQALRAKVTLVWTGILLVVGMSSCGGGSSSTSQVPPPANNSVPSLISFSPFNATAGGAGFLLTLTGSGFAPNATVTWDGNALATTFVSSNQLTAQVKAADIAAPGIAQITISNPAPGGGVSNVFRFGVNPASPPANFLYAANFGDNTISGYSVDPISGALTALPSSPYAAAALYSNPGPMIRDRFGRFLYVANNGNLDCKECYSLTGLGSAGSGALTPLAGSPFFGLFSPTAFAADPTGNVVYLSAGPPLTNYGDILTTSIDANSGALTQVADSPGFLPLSSMVENPAGSFLYGTSQVVAATNGVWVGSISPTTGAVTVVSGSPFGGMALSALALTPSGKYLFAVNDNEGNVPQSTLLSFTINPTTGGLTPLNSIPYNFPVTLGGVVVHPSGGFLYVSDQGDNTILGFSIGGNGNLTPLAGSPFSAGAGSINPNFLAVDPAGKFLYAANYDGGSVAASNISAFTVDSSSGALTPVAGSPFPAGVEPNSLVIGP